MNGTQPDKTPQVNWVRIMGIFLAVIAGIYVISRVLRVLREGSGGAASFSGGGVSEPFDYLPPELRVIYSLVWWGMLLLAACVVVRILKR